MRNRLSAGLAVFLCFVCMSPLTTMAAAHGHSGGGPQNPPVRASNASGHGEAPTASRSHTHSTSNQSQAGTNHGISSHTTTSNKSQPPGSVSGSGSSNKTQAPQSRKATHVKKPGLKGPTVDTSAKLALDVNRVQSSLVSQMVRDNRVIHSLATQRKNPHVTARA